MSPIIPPNRPNVVPAGAVGPTQEAMELDANVHAAQAPSPDISQFADGSHQHLPPEPPAAATHTIANHGQPGSAEPPEEEARLKNVHYPIESPLILPSEWKAAEKKNQNQNQKSKGEPK